MAPLRAADPRLTSRSRGTWPDPGRRLVYDLGTPRPGRSRSASSASRGQRFGGCRRARLARTSGSTARSGTASVPDALQGHAPQRVRDASLGAPDRRPAGPLRLQDCDLACSLVSPELALVDPELAQRLRGRRAGTFGGRKRARANNGTAGAPAGPANTAGGDAVARGAPVHGGLITADQLGDLIREQTATGTRSRSRSSHGLSAGGAGPARADAVGPAPAGGFSPPIELVRRPTASLRPPCPSPFRPFPAPELVAVAPVEAPRRRPSSSADRLRAAAGARQSRRRAAGGQAARSRRRAPHRVGPSEPTPGRATPAAEHEPETRPRKSPSRCWCA